MDTSHTIGHQSRMKTLKDLIGTLEEDFDEQGAPEEQVIAQAQIFGFDQSKVEHEIEKLKRKGEVYTPAQGYIRST